MKRTLLLLASLLALSVNAKDLTDKDVFVSPQETPINILQNEQTTQPKTGGTNLTYCGQTQYKIYWCNQDPVVNEDTKAISLKNEQVTPKTGGTDLAVCGSKIGENRIWCNQDPVVNEDTKAISLSTPINVLENEQATNPKTG